VAEILLGSEHLHQPLPLTVSQLQKERAERQRRGAVNFPTRLSGSHPGDANRYSAAVTLCSPNLHPVGSRVSSAIAA
jgi:hypothetical protein